MPGRGLRAGGQAVGGARPAPDSERFEPHSFVERMRRRAHDLLVFTEAVGDEFGERRQRGFGVRAAGGDDDC